MIIIYNDFQRFWSSKSARNTIVFIIQDRYFWSLIWSFPKNAFETAEFWGIVNLTVILRLLHKKSSTFP